VSVKQNTASVELPIRKLKINVPDARIFGDGEQRHGGDDVHEGGDATAVEGSVTVLHPRPYRKYAHAPPGCQLEVLRGTSGKREM
jgi:hypothetical protein